MKKIWIFVCLLLVLVGCQSIKEKPLVLTPDGIPSIALGGLYDEDVFDVSVVTGVDLITSQLVLNDYDFIVAPITAGAKLYMNQQSSYKLAAVLTLGNTFVFAKGEASLESIYDLEGKRIVAYGRNNTPDIVLQHALNTHDVSAEVVYEASVQDVLSNRISANDDSEYFLLAEPVLSTVLHKLNIEGSVLDLQDVLNEDIPSICQAGLFVKSDAKQVESILHHIESNITEINDNAQNYVTKLLNKDKVKFPSFSNLGNDVLVQSIPRSHIVFFRAKEAKEDIITFFNVINEYNPEILGGTIPSDSFYFE